MYKKSSTYPLLYLFCQLLREWFPVMSAHSVSNESMPHDPNGAKCVTNSQLPVVCPSAASVHICLHRYSPAQLTGAKQPRMALNSPFSGKRTESPLMFSILTGWGHQSPIQNSKLKELFFLPWWCVMEQGGSWGETRTWGWGGTMQGQGRGLMEGGGGMRGF